MNARAVIDSIFHLAVAPTVLTRKQYVEKLSKLDPRSMVYWTGSGPTPRNVRIHVNAGFEKKTFENDEKYSDIVGFRVLSTDPLHVKYMTEIPESMWTSQPLIDSIFHLNPVDPVPVKVPDDWVASKGFTGAVEFKNGNKAWIKDGKLHRDGDLPAIIWSNGDKGWWKDGELHREGDLPAAIYADGTKMWFKDGKRHRDGDLPAVIYASGGKEWWKDGKRIRSEQP